MQRSPLDSLLTSLNVCVEAVAVCEISENFALTFEPYDAPVVHHIVHGAGVIEVQGSAPIPFRRDSMLLIPPRRRKRIYVGEPAIAVAAKDRCSTAPTGLLRLDGTDGSARDVIIVCGALRATIGPFCPLDDLSAPLLEDMSHISAVRVAFQMMLTEQACPVLCSGALSSALMKQCLLLFIRQHFLANDHSALALALRDERLARALTSILEHPRDLCMRDLAASAHMSRSAFAKRFVEVFRTTPMEFARRTRLHRAAELLIATDLPIKTIASEAGFASRSQFCRAFRAAFDVHPSAYRKSQRQMQAAPMPISHDDAAGSAPPRAFMAKVSD